MTLYNRTPSSPNRTNSRSRSHHRITTHRTPLISPSLTNALTRPNVTNVNQKKLKIAPRTRHPPRNRNHTNHNRSNPSRRTNTDPQRQLRPNSTLNSSSTRKIRPQHNRSSLNHRRNRRRSTSQIVTRTRRSQHRRRRRQSHFLTRTRRNTTRQRRRRRRQRRHRQLHTHRPSRNRRQTIRRPNTRSSTRNTTRSRRRNRRTRHNPITKTQSRAIRPHVRRSQITTKHRRNSPLQALQVNRVQVSHSHPLTPLTKFSQHRTPKHRSINRRHRRYNRHRRRSRHIKQPTLTTNNLTRITRQVSTYATPIQTQEYSPTNGHNNNRT